MKRARPEISKDQKKILYDTFLWILHMVILFI